MDRDMTRPTPARVRVTTLATITIEPWAECASCEWSRSQLRNTSWPAVREAARRHAASTGHVTTASYRVMRDYGVTATRPA